MNIIILGTFSSLHYTTLYITRFVTSRVNDRVWNVNVPRQLNRCVSTTSRFLLLRAWRFDIECQKGRYSFCISNVLFRKRWKVLFSFQVQLQFLITKICSIIWKINRRSKIKKVYHHLVSKITSRKIISEKFSSLNKISKIPWYNQIY